MDENQAPLTAQKRSSDLFSDSNAELLNTTQAASICGVSYHKFLREFGEIPYSFVYPGGPRIYMRSEVRAFIEGKNKGLSFRLIYPKQTILCVRFIDIINRLKAENSQLVCQANRGCAESQS